MKTGDIILIPFPFAELTNRKVRPAVVIAETADKYKDLVISAISSVVPDRSYSQLCCPLKKYIGDESGMGYRLLRCVSIQCQFVVPDTRKSTDCFPLVPRGRNDGR